MQRSSPEDPVRRPSPAPLCGQQLPCRHPPHVVASHALDVEIQTDPRFSEVGMLAGLDEARRWYEGIRDAWEDGGVAAPGEVKTLEGVSRDARIFRSLSGVPNLRL
jgi:hypothetical protein